MNRSRLIYFLVLAVVALCAPVCPQAVGLPELKDKPALSGDIASLLRPTPSLPGLEPIGVMRQSAGADDDATVYIDDLLNYARSFTGLRYRRGGKTTAGFDCSGFTGHVFGEFGIKLPADSRSQYTQGDAVERHDLRPGDLVFFTGRSAASGRVGHVGIVTSVDDATGRFRFIHSANSSGITESSSTEPYYRRRYLGARRVNQ